ncbi:hypothetical protein ACQ4PT_066881 [Festuca glaucescens]
METAAAATDDLQQPCRPRLGAQLCSGSKNRGPKLPVVIAHEWPSAIRAHVLEVPAGRDVLSCVAPFAWRGNRGALALGATGRVADAVLCRDPSPLELWGTAKILGLEGCFFPSSASPSGVAVFLAKPRGTVLGSGVAEKGLVATGPVVFMVATFVAAAFDRLCC